MCHKLSYAFSVVLVLSLVGNVFAQDLEWDFYIPYAFTPPALDGEVDGVWANASTQEMTIPINGTVDSHLDAGGHWQVMWDSEYLYLIVEIVDSELVNDTATTWQDDSIEFYFDGGNTKEAFDACSTWPARA